MMFKFLAEIQGGTGDKVWENEVTVGGEDMTISQALQEVENALPYDAVVVSISQED